MIRPSSQHLHGCRSWEGLPHFFVCRNPGNKGSRARVKIRKVKKKFEKLEFSIFLHFRAFWLRCSALPFVLRSKPRAKRETPASICSCGRQASSAEIHVRSPLIPLVAYPCRLPCILFHARLVLDNIGWAKENICVHLWRTAVVTTDGNFKDGQGRKQQPMMSFLAGLLACLLFRLVERISADPSDR